jgi:hypothetical protein
MLKLVALRRLRYPRGIGGKEYEAGDTFDALSDRDAKALTLIRAARDADEKPPSRAPQSRPARLVQQTVEPEDTGQPVAPMSTQTTAPLTDRPRRYRRSDMQPDDK